MGAFYPLFILRPLESGRQDLVTLYTVLNALKQVGQRRGGEGSGVENGRAVGGYFPP